MVFLQAATEAPVACTAFCLAMTDLVGPGPANVILTVLAAGALWYSTRRKIAAVSAVAQQAVQRADQAESKAQVATHEAVIAKSEATNANSQVQQLVASSLRPGAPTPGSGASGLYAPVSIEGLDRLPRPGGVPSDVKPVPPREEEP